VGSRRRRTAASRRRETIHAAAYATTRLAAAHAGGLQQESRAAILRASGGARVAELPTAARGTAGPWATCQARGITQCREAATSAHQQRGWQAASSEAATTQSAIQSESKSLSPCRSKWDADTFANPSKSEGLCRIVFASVPVSPRGRVSGGVFTRILLGSYRRRAVSDTITELENKPIGFHIIDHPLHGKRASLGLILGDATPLRRVSRRFEWKGAVPSSCQLAPLPPINGLCNSRLCRPHLRP
jgi:hypothetical protein